MAACLASSHVLAQASDNFAHQVTGVARVVDADTLAIDDIKVRIHGIDAPESNQACGSKEKQWACGRFATEYLEWYINKRPVNCGWNEEDRYGRVIATCMVDGEDLAGMLTGAGLALAYRRYSDDYVEQEQAARTAKSGIWSGPFATPSEHRSGRDFRKAGKDTISGFCPFRGTTSLTGHKMYYQSAHIHKPELNLPDDGTLACFASETEAQSAGYRKI